MFSIFMFITMLIMPLTMIIFGKLFIKRPPEKINSIFGYRTTMSMKNKDTWEFANKTFGKVWYDMGRISLLSVLPLFLVWGKDEDTIGFVSIVIMVIQMIFLIGPISYIEKKLRDNFDKDGNRKNSTE